MHHTASSETRSQILLSLSRINRYLIRSNHVVLEANSLFAPSIDLLLRRLDIDSHTPITSVGVEHVAIRINAVLSELIKRSLLRRSTSDLLIAVEDRSTRSRIRHLNVVQRHTRKERILVRQGH